MPWLPPHVPVGARRARVARVSDELRRNGVDVQPVHIEGRSIARSFWGRRWCHHLESCSDFENRLPRGRAYVRNGSVCHLDVHAGGVDAMVVGSDLYHVVVRIRKLGQVAWKAIRAECAGRVGSGLERPTPTAPPPRRSLPLPEHPPGVTPGPSAASTLGSTDVGSRMQPSPPTSPSSTTRGAPAASASTAVAAACFRARLAGEASPAGEGTAWVLAGYRRTASTRSSRG